MRGLHEFLHSKFHLGGCVSAIPSPQCPQGTVAQVDTFCRCRMTGHLAWQILIGAVGDVALVYLSVRYLVLPRLERFVRERIRREISLHDRLGRRS